MEGLEHETSYKDKQPDDTTPQYTWRIHYIRSSFHISGIIRIYQFHFQIIEQIILPRLKHLNPN